MKELHLIVRKWMQTQNIPQIFFCVLTSQSIYQCRYKYSLCYGSNQITPKSIFHWWKTLFLVPWCLGFSLITDAACVWQLWSQFIHLPYSPIKIRGPQRVLLWHVFKNVIWEFSPFPYYIVNYRFDNDTWSITLCINYYDILNSVCTLRGNGLNEYVL